MEKTFIRIQVNGKPEQVESPVTVHEFLQKRGVNPNVVACELNLKIIKRAHLNETKIQEGDILEIIQMIGGG